MLEIFNKWYERYLFEEESVLLLVLLLLSLVLLATIGDILAPLLAAIVLAYLVQGVVNLLCRLGMPEWAGLTVAFTVFVGLFFGRLHAALEHVTDRDHTGVGLAQEHVQVAVHTVVADADHTDGDLVAGGVGAEDAGRDDGGKTDTCGGCESRGFEELAAFHGGEGRLACAACEVLFRIRPLAQA